MLPLLLLILEKDFDRPIPRHGYHGGAFWEGVPTTQVYLAEARESPVAVNLSHRLVKHQLHWGSTEVERSMT